MLKKPFQFKQFQIADDRCTMKVGTDGVLLGAWVNCQYSKNILDIGTGSGLIALMLAQRNPLASIHGVELLEADALQAKENASASPWKDRVMIHHTSIESFESAQRFDLIVSNPPFFSDSLLPPTASRSQVRHAVSLTQESLLHAAQKLITPNGSLAVILPVTEGSEFRTLAVSKGFYCNRSMAFYSRSGRAQERWLFEFSRENKPEPTEELVLHGDGNSWSDAYTAMTQAFYLKV